MVVGTQELLPEAELPAQWSFEDDEGDEHPVEEIEGQLGEEEVDPPVHMMLIYI